MSALDATAFYSFALLHTEGIRQGCAVVPTGTPLTAPAGDALLGRLIDGLGNPIDDKGDLPDNLKRVPINNTPPNPMTRKRILSPIETGIKVIDGLLTIGAGQRMGIFAGSGVGKSTLMGMICRSSKADINVIFLSENADAKLRIFWKKILARKA